MPQASERPALLGRIHCFLASSKLAVVLMALAMVLVYAASGVQKTTSVFQVQRTFFHSLFVWVDINALLLYGTHFRWPGGRSPCLPMPGGIALGILIIVNLAAAHTRRPKSPGSRIGVWLIHGGLLALLAGDLLASQYTIRSVIALDEGQSKNYAEDEQEPELAVTDTSPDDHDEVTVISAARLRQKGTIHDPRLPFDIEVREYYANSQILEPERAQTAGQTAPVPAISGSNPGAVIVERPRDTGADANADRAAAIVVVRYQGRELGVLGLSQWLMDAEDIHIGSARYLLQLRAKRYYKPYAITLLKFTHDRYTGTDRPKNFSSLIRLIDPSHGEDREVNIWMNHPLRYPSWRDPAGETIYQLSAGAEDRGTVLQVVRNPAWWIPYLACLVGSAGMLIHFLPRLSRYMAKPAPRAAWDRPSVLTAAAGVILCGGCFIAWLVPPSVKGVDTAEFGKIPICYEGRVQPLDSAARNSLKLLSGHDTIKGRDGRRRPAIAWLLDLFAGREAAEDYKVFRIDYPDLVDMLGPDSSQKLFSWRELRDSSAKLEPQLRRLEKTDPARFDQFQMALAELRGKIGLFAALNRFGGLYLAPPATPGAEWRPLEPMGPGSAAGQGIEYLRLFNSMLDACVEGQPAEFNRLLADYRGQVRRQAPADSQAVEFEAFFNRADPFFFCQLLYVLIFVMVVVSWLAWTKPLGRAALTVLILTLILHTLGLAGEISISGRPPVTDLTSSAIFIAWGIGLVCLILERIFRNGIGIVIAAILGFCSLHIAYRLSLRGEDAFQVLMAVLDTNFWLATHVLCISFGYAASFLAGFMGIAYLVMGLGTKRLAGARGKPLADMIYGTVVFAAIMSFVGTVLGGIWADQSWGRFWGWDPKENGALLVVLTNVLLLHARWGGLVRNRGMALLAIFGNIVTAWSWFGTNMYGVGLHSYGHMESGQPWLIGFVLSQFLLILLGWFLPSCAWTSLRDLESI